jgi:hypothetical protein
VRSGDGGGRQTGLGQLRCNDGDAHTKTYELRSDGGLPHQGETSWAARWGHRDWVERVHDADATDAAHRADLEITSCESLVQRLPALDNGDRRLWRRRLSQSDTYLAKKSGP